MTSVSPVPAALTLLRLLPARLPGKRRLAQALMNTFLPDGPADIETGGITFRVPSVREPVAAAVADLAPLVDEFLAVDDYSLRGAMRALHESEGIAVEPSAIAGIAAIAAWGSVFSGRRVLTVLTGANLTDAQRAEYFERPVAETATA